MQPTWFKNTILYAVSVELFQDSDGDGVGDFKGLTERLPYLVDLGVECLWILPFYPTPGRDDGYDVCNYLDIDPRLGSLADFEEFLDRARQLNLRVLIDLVVNHTSDQHPWFQAARRDPQSGYHDYYVWSPQPVEEPKSTIFPGQVNSVWTYDDKAQAFYFHRFYPFEPGLKIANQQVQAEVQRIMDFWLSFPISGFRIDAASHLVERKGLPDTKPDQPHEILRRFSRFASGRNPEAILLGEADVDLGDIEKFFGGGEELQTLFNFLISEHLFLALARQRAAGLIDLLARLPFPKNGVWVNFLRNLDELDAERLSRAEREDLYKAFAPVPGMRIFNRGIRRRTAPMLSGERRRIENAYSLLFSLPGSPMIVYGDEIGMGDNLFLSGRSAVRTPMQWSAGPNAGFSQARSEDLIRSPITGGLFDYRLVNVEQQQQDQASLLQWMQELIKTRKAHPEIGQGQLVLLESGDERVLAHACMQDGQGILAVHNFSDQHLKITLDLAQVEGARLQAGFGNQHTESAAAAARIEQENSHLELELGAYGYQWFELKN